MLSLPPAVKVFVCTEPVDCRRSFDGLARAVEEVVREHPMSGHLFVFRNRAGDRAKVLGWDRSGYCIWYKRLEAGGGSGSRKERTVAWRWRVRSWLCCSKRST
jgi:transposase